MIFHKFYLQKFSYVKQFNGLIFCYIVCFSLLLKRLSLLTAAATLYFLHTGKFEKLIMLMGATYHISVVSLVRYNIFPLASLQLAGPDLGAFYQWAILLAKQTGFT